MKKTDSHQTEKKVWTGATVGAILAGGVAGVLSRDKKRNKRRMQSFLSARKWFIFAVVFLVICVLATTFLLIGQLDQYLYKKEHNIEIDLMAEPGFQMDDGSGNMAFSTVTQDPIFHASYTGADGETLTVVSADGDAVVAPGTQGEYVFRIKNTDELPVIYSVVLDGFFSIENTEHLIPILVRMKGNEGDYLIGSESEWSPISELKNISDAGTLKGKTSRYYTIEWMWPYESGNDALDTMLGNGTLNIEGAPTLAPDDNLEFSIQIETLAMLPVEDRAPFTVFFDRALPILLAVSILLLITALVMVFKYRYDDKKSKQ